MSAPLVHPSISQASRFKDQGNALYAKSQYKDALRCYTRGIAALRELAKERFPEAFDGVMTVEDRSDGSKGGDGSGGVSGWISAMFGAGLGGSTAPTVVPGTLHRSKRGSDDDEEYDNAATNDGLERSLRSHVPGGHEQAQDDSELSSMSATLYSNRAITHLKLHKHVPALSDATVASRLKPTWPKPHFRRGEALLALDQIPEALRSYKTALELDPQSSVAQSRLAQANRIMRELDKGLRIYPLSPGRDFCMKSSFTPINNFIFEFAKQMQNLVYLITDMTSRHCFIVDPCWDTDGLIQVINQKHLTLKGVILTHHHFDHRGGVPPDPFQAYNIRVQGLWSLFKKYARIKCYCHPFDRKILLNEDTTLSQDRFVDTVDGYSTVLGDAVVMRFLHTPGHTAGSQCVLVQNRFLLTGDTLFYRGIGRSDVAEDADAGMLFKSLKRLSALEPDIAVYPGHSYGSERTSIHEETKEGVLKGIQRMDFRTWQAMQS